MDSVDVFRFETLEFSSGETVQIPRVGVVVLIGPNNVGKSTALGERPVILGAEVCWRSAIRRVCSQ